MVVYSRTMVISELFCILYSCFYIDPRVSGGHPRGSRTYPTVQKRSIMQFLYVAVVTFSFFLFPYGPRAPHMGHQGPPYGGPGPPHIWGAHGPLFPEKKFALQREFFFLNRGPGPPILFGGPGPPEKSGGPGPLLFRGVRGGFASPGKY